MIRKTAIAVGVGAVVLLGAAGTAFAAESDTTPTSAPAPTSTAAPDHAAGHAHRHADRLFRGEYGTWTTFDTKTHTATVHDAIRGTVSAVSSTAITVKAVDGTSQTYAVGTGTKVHVKGDSTAPTIGQVKVGDRAVVVGTGSGTLTATRVLDRGAPTTTAPTSTPAS